MSIQLCHSAFKLASQHEERVSLSIFEPFHWEIKTRAKGRKEIRGPSIEMRACLLSFQGSSLKEVLAAELRLEVKNFPFHASGRGFMLAKKFLV